MGVVLMCDSLHWSTVWSTSLDSLGIGKSTVWFSLNNMFPPHKLLFLIDFTFSSLSGFVCFDMILLHIWYTWKTIFTIKMSTQLLSEYHVQYYVHLMSFDISFKTVASWGLSDDLHSVNTQSSVFAHYLPSICSKSSRKLKLYFI